MSILNQNVSYFPSLSDTTNGITVGLLSLLHTNKHKDRILHLRQCDELEQKLIKDKLPCYTVPGTFHSRCKEGLIKLPGLACVDLDSAEDYELIHLLNELKKINCIAYAGLSCRGKRLFCIVPFLYPEKYIQYYEMLIKSFEAAGLPMGDECHKCISQPRFVSWNDENTQFFNHTAKPYPFLPPERTYITIKKNNQTIGENSIPENSFQWCVEQINKSHSFEETKRHLYIISLACYCNKKGLDQETTLNGCLQFIQNDFEEKEIRDIVKHIYSTQKDSHGKLPFKTWNPSQKKNLKKKGSSPFKNPKFHLILKLKLFNLKNQK